MDLCRENLEKDICEETLEKSHQCEQVKDGLSTKGPSFSIFNIALSTILLPVAKKSIHNEIKIAKIIMDKILIGDLGAKTRSIRIM